MVFRLDAFVTDIKSLAMDSIDNSIFNISFSIFPILVVRFRF